MKMKNNLYYTFCALLLAALWLLAGCSSSEEWSPQPVSGDLYITIDPSTYASSNDLNACESRIEKLRVFVFNSDGSFDNMISTTTLPVKVRVSAGTNKRVIAVANEPAAAAGYLAAANTVNGVQQVMYDLSDYLPIEMGSSDALYYGNLGTNVTAASTGYTLPMYGEATGVNVTYANTEGSPMGVSVALSRCVARIDIYIRKKAGVGVVGKLLPASTRLGVLQYPGNILNRPTGGGGYYPYPYESPAYGAGFLAPDHITPWNSGYCSQLEFIADNLTIPVATGVTNRSDYKLCYSFYVPETDYSSSSWGMLRPVLWGFDWNGKKQNYFPDCLGATVNPDGTTSLTVSKLSRNTVYRLFWTLAPRTEDIETELQVCPWEVEPIQPAPTGDLHITNCYILPLGGSVHIPIREIYDIYRVKPELGGILSETDPITAEVVWYGAYNDVVAAPQIIGAGINSDKYIEVKAKERATWNGSDDYDDNALVGLKVNGKIVWSFHIWVTNYNPNNPVNQRTSAAVPGIVMMDRCLGQAARSNTTFYPLHGVGLLYQVGRKDPFPARVGYQISPHLDMSGKEVTYHVPKVSMFSTEFENPTRLYVERELKYIYQGRTYSVDPKSLWNGENGRKTIYDPCPEGWKIMPSRVVKLTKAQSNLTSLTDIHGNYRRHSDWGDLPAAGVILTTATIPTPGIYPPSPSFWSTQSWGSLWSVDPGEPLGVLAWWIEMPPNQTSLEMSVSLRKEAYFVRCVKE